MGSQTQLGRDCWWRPSWQWDSKGSVPSGSFTLAHGLQLHTLAATESRVCLTASADMRRASRQDGTAAANRCQLYFECTSLIKAVNGGHANLQEWSLWKLLDKKTWFFFSRNHVSTPDMLNIKPSDSLEGAGADIKSLPNAQKRTC